MPFLLPHSSSCHTGKRRKIKAVTFIQSHNPKNCIDIFVSEKDTHINETHQENYSKKRWFHSRSSKCFANKADKKEPRFAKTEMQIVRDERIFWGILKIISIIYKRDKTTKKTAMRLYIYYRLRIYLEHVNHVSVYWCQCVTSNVWLYAIYYGHIGKLEYVKYIKLGQKGQKVYSGQKLWVYIISTKKGCFLEPSKTTTLCRKLPGLWRMPKWNWP